MFRKYGIITLIVWAAFGVLVAVLTGSGRVTERVLEIVVPVALGVSFFIALSVLLAILVHELGHVVGGLAAGFRFQAVQVGPFELRRQPSGFKFGIVENPRLSGFARMFPKSDEGLVSRMLVFILGGPVASVLYVGATYLLFRYFPEPRRGAPLFSVVPHLGSMCLFVMGISVLPGTLIPFTSANGTPTDMKVLLTLLGPKGARERLVSLVLIGRELQAGVRARNWSRSLIEPLLALRDGRIEELRARILAYYFYEDSGDLLETRAQIDRAVELARVFGRKAGTLAELAFQESAYVSAWYDHDVEAATKCLGEIASSTPLLKGSASLTAAVVALRHGERDRARELLIESHRATEEFHTRYGGATSHDFDRIERVRASLERDE